MLRRSFLRAVVGGASASLSGCYFLRPKVSVGSKVSTEQRIIGELVSQHLAGTLNARVTRKLGLGETSTLHRGILNSEIDVYPEYTGDAILNVLGEQASADAERVWDRVRGEYERIYKLEYFAPLGINNHFSIAIPAKLAAQHNLKTLSDAAAAPGIEWSLSCTREFLDRREGHAALTSAYHLNISKAPAAFEPERVYRAVDDGISNMAAGNETDGVLSTKQYVSLADDKGAFAHWQPCLVTRKDYLASNGGMREALGKLSGKINNDQMRRLCFLVDVERVDAGVVVGDWLKSQTWK